MMPHGENKAFVTLKMREPHVIAQFATSLSKLENKGFTQILNKICFSDIFGNHRF